MLPVRCGSASLQEEAEERQKGQGGRFGHYGNLDVVVLQVGAVRAADAEQGDGLAGVVDLDLIGRESVVIDAEFDQVAFQIVDDVRAMHPVVGVFRQTEILIIVFGRGVNDGNAFKKVGPQHQFARSIVLAVLLEVDEILVHPFGILEDGGRNEEVELKLHQHVGRDFQGVHEAAVVAAVFHVDALLVVGGDDVGDVFTAVVIHPFVLAGEGAEAEEGLLKVGEVIDVAGDESEDGGGAAGFPGVHSDSEPVVVVFQVFPVDRDVDIDGAFHRAAGLAQGDGVVEVEDFRREVEAASAGIADAVSDAFV